MAGMYRYLYHPTGIYALALRNELGFCKQIITGLPPCKSRRLGFTTYITFQDDER